MTDKPRKHSAMPDERWRPTTGDFVSIRDRDAWMADNAEYFTVVRHLGPREGYERHEVKTLAEAVEMAGRMAKVAKRPYLIYAVVGELSAFVKSVS